MLRNVESRKRRKRLNARSSSNVSTNVVAPLRMKLCRTAAWGDDASGRWCLSFRGERRSVSWRAVGANAAAAAAIRQLWERVCLTPGCSNPQRNTLPSSSSLWYCRPSLVSMASSPGPLGSGTQTTLRILALIRGRSDNSDLDEIGQLIHLCLFQVKKQASGGNGPRATVAGQTPSPGSASKTPFRPFPVQRNFRIHSSAVNAILWTLPRATFLRVAGYVA